jgi:hypothetical protein
VEAPGSQALPGPVRAGAVVVGYLVRWFRTDRWVTARAAEIIWWRFGILYRPGHFRLPLLALRRSLHKPERCVPIRWGGNCLVDTGGLVPEKTLLRATGFLCCFPKQVQVLFIRSLRRPLQRLLNIENASEY